MADVQARGKGAPNQRRREQASGGCAIASQPEHSGRRGHPTPDRLPSVRSSVRPTPCPRHSLCSPFTATNYERVARISARPLKPSVALQPRCRRCHREPYSKPRLKPELRELGHAVLSNAVEFYVLHEHTHARAWPADTGSMRRRRRRRIPAPYPGKRETCAREECGRSFLSAKARLAKLGTRPMGK